MKLPPKCPYCGADSVMTRGDVIYPHRPDLAEKAFWLCKPCNAYVGCHPNTRQPLGRLADESLRRQKSAVHRVLDPLWKTGRMKRREAYQLLADGLGIQLKKCHVGWFDLETCNKALEVLNPRKETI